MYDTTTTATLSGAAAVTALGSDTVTAAGAAAGTFATKIAELGKSVTVTGVTLAGGDAGNYNVVQQSGLIADITAKSITATGLTGVTRYYNTTTVAGLAGTAAISNGATGELDGKYYSSDVVTVSGGVGAFNNRNAWTGKTVTVTGLTLGGTDATNYTVSHANTIATIRPKPLNVAGLTGVSKVYDTTTGVSLTGTAVFVSGASSPYDTKYYTGDVVTVSGTALGAFVDKNAGSAKSVTVTGLTYGGADIRNYSVQTPTGVRADITAKSITATGLTGVNKVYDTTTVAGLTGTAVISNGASSSSDGKYYSSDVVTVSGTAGAFNSANVGTNKAVTVSVTSSNSNYAITHADTVADITPGTVVTAGPPQSVQSAVSGVVVNKPSVELLAVVPMQNIRMGFLPSMTQVGRGKEATFYVTSISGSVVTIGEKIATP